MPPIPEIIQAISLYLEAVITTPATRPHPGTDSRPRGAPWPPAATWPPGPEYAHSHDFKRFPGRKSRPRGLEPAPRLMASDSRPAAFTRFQTIFNDS